MKIKGTHDFAAPRDIVWPMLLDPNVLASVLPGAEKLEEVGENEYEGKLKIKVGPVQGKFKGNVKLTNIKDNEGYDIAVSGRGPAGIVNGTGTLTLTETNGTTQMSYSGDAQVGGRLASVGQRLLDTSTKAIIRQSLEGLDRQVQAQAAAQHAPPPEESSPSAQNGAPSPSTATRTAEPFTPTPPPSQTEFALGVAKNFMEELLPEENRDQTVQRIVYAAAGLFLLRLIARWWAKQVAKAIAKELKK